MSARRAVPKGSALPVAPEFAKQGGSRLDHVLSVGMSNAKLGNNISFALAHKAPIVNVGISILRKTLKVVPAANIGINWQTWDAGEEDDKVQQWVTKVEKALAIYPNNGLRTKVYELAELIRELGSPTGLARSGSVNRGYYIYLLQVFERAVTSAQTQGADGAAFEKIWVAIVQKVEKQTALFAKGVLSDMGISNDVKSNIFAYFNAVNQLYNFFTLGDIMAGRTSPTLTAYLQSLLNPPEDVRNVSDILRGMAADPRNKPST
jgi:hypothetical protein